MSWTNVLDYLMAGCYRRNMAVQLNIADAKAKLSELVARAEAGEQVVLARAGKPIVTLTPVAGATKRTPGAWAHLGKLGDPDLFLRPDPELGADADGPIFPTPIFPTSGGFHEP